MCHDAKLWKITDFDISGAEIRENIKEKLGMVKYVRDVTLSNKCVQISQSRIRQIMKICRRSLVTYSLEFISLSHA